MKKCFWLVRDSWLHPGLSWPAHIGQIKKGKVETICGKSFPEKDSETDIWFDEVTSLHDNETSCKACTSLASDIVNLLGKAPISLELKVGGNTFSVMN